MTSQSVNPYDSKISKTFEKFTDKQPETAVWNPGGLLHVSAVAKAMADSVQAG